MALIATAAGLSTGCGDKAAEGGGVTNSVRVSQETVAAMWASVLRPSEPSVVRGESSKATVRPTLHAVGSRFVSSQSLTHAEIAQDARAGFTIRTRSLGEIGVTPTQVRGAATGRLIAGGDAVFFRDIYPGTDEVWRPAGVGLTAFIRLRSDRAPGAFSWKLALPPGAQLKSFSGGELANVIDRAGAVALLVDPPGQVDSTGKVSLTRIAVDGHTLTITPSPDAVELLTMVWLDPLTQPSDLRLDRKSRGTARRPDAPQAHD